MHSTSDYLKHPSNSTHTMMLWVLLALVPGTIASSYYLGSEILANLAIASASALFFEACILKLRHKSLGQLLDLSALVTACLLALCLPPSLPAWMIVVGSFFAIVFAKHLYGGLGNNLFNPAMVGYAVLIVSFPLAMSTWPDVIASDGSSGATALDTFKFRGTQTIDEIWRAENGFAQYAGIGWQWINLAFLVGGLSLVFLKVAKWQAPLAMLLTLAVLSIMFYDDGGSNSFGSPLFHMLSGGTMLCAFFITTDPATSPDSNKGLLFFGMGIGVIIFIIRSQGAYPDGAAFAILLMNAVVPLMEAIRQKRI